MADNTEQYEWIVKIKENLEILFADNPNVFVAGDLLWYPRRDRKITGPVAPDVMVAFGRPKGRRGSYKQWEENDIPPRVVFEILSPSNDEEEMNYKHEFYQKYGVEEYYLYDPPTNNLRGWIRSGESLERIVSLDGWRSPRLGISFAMGDGSLEIYYPDGRRFLSSIELARDLERERSRAEQLSSELENELRRVRLMEEYLRSSGIDPDNLNQNT